MVTLGVAIGSAFYSLYQGEIKAKSQYAVLELKVNTIWDFLIRRAKSEGYNKGLFAENSPLIIAPQAIEVFTPLIPDLEKIAETLPETTPERDLIAKLDQLIGNRLIKEVCPKLQIEAGSCLIIASALIKEYHAKKRKTQ